MIRGLGAIAVTGAAQPIFALAKPEVPLPIVTNLVLTPPSRWNGSECLPVELTNEEQKARVSGGGGGNRPGHAIVHREFLEGTIEVDVGAELRQRRTRCARLRGIGFPYQRRSSEL